MKNFKNFLLMTVTLSVLSVANAGPGGANASSAKYVINVSLVDRERAVGTLSVVENLEGGGQRTLRTCDAIGGWEPHSDGQPSKKTPRGTHGVDEAFVDLKYKGANGWTWIRGVNATYFTDFFGRPVAIHTGALSDNSHACVRTTSACSSYIMNLANSVATPANGQSIIGRPKRNFSMAVVVSYQ